MAIELKNYGWQVDDTSASVGENILNALENIAVFGTNGTGIGQFNSPNGITVIDNRLFVCDYNNHRIQSVNVDGSGNMSNGTTFGTNGTGIGQFSNPTGITVIGNRLFVCDYNNHRIQRI